MAHATQVPNGKGTEADQVALMRLSKLDPKTRRLVRKRIRALRREKLDNDEIAAKLREEGFKRPYGPIDRAFVSNQLTWISGSKSARKQSARPAARSKPKQSARPAARSKPKLLIQAVLESTLPVEQKLAIIAEQIEKL